MLALKKAGCWLVVLACVAGAQTGPKQITQSEALAMVVTRVNPEFPEVARKLKIAGEVDIEITIAASGLVESAKPVSGNPVLTRSAIDALKKWKFKPFQQDGEAVKVQVTFKLMFKE